jgi:hypothetical protein
MATQTHTSDRVSHILALMKEGDDAFNPRTRPRWMPPTTPIWSRT